MRKSMALGSIALALAACGGGGGGGPTGNGNVPAVAGSYQATFTAVSATGCQGLVTGGDSTTGTLVVTQSGSAVTLRISDLRDEFGSNPVGTVSSSGAFHFGPGAVVIDPDPATPGDEFSATGTFDGTFSGTTMNISFNFTALTCTVTGTIVGQR
jgi:hypothetical protein